MKLIVGLGNPGKEYEGTRHNAGYLFVEALACEPELAPAGECILFHTEKKFEAMIAETSAKGEKIILVKPLTYMNLSGQAVQKIMQFYKIEPADLIVVSDDKDLPLGTVRIRKEGSSGGQKGLQNIIDSINLADFMRIRIGINFKDGDLDKLSLIQDKMETRDFVLSQFGPRDLPMVKTMISDTIAYILPYIGSKEEIPAHTLQAND